MKITIGTRGSKLAMWQAKHVKRTLEQHHPNDEFHIHIVKTTGDKDQHTPLSQMGGVGLFTKQLEQSLDGGDVDVAVHSCKDLPSEVEERFVLPAFLEREKPMDAFISPKLKLADLKEGVVVGTGSLRRASQLKDRFPGIETRDLRGNVDTRLAKLERGDYDALILAYAGVHRLGLDDVIAEIIPIDVLVPAAAQGAVAVEARKGDKDVIALLACLDHQPTRAAIQEERSFLRVVEGGCKVPVGCHGWFEKDRFRLSGFIGSLDGSRVVRHEMDLPADDYRDAGEVLGRAMLADGGEEILDEIRRSGDGIRPS